MISRSTVTFAAFAAVVLPAATFVTSGLLCLLLNHPVTAVSADTNVRIKDDQLILQGSINSELASRLQQVLARPHEKINVLLLSSIGGDERPAQVIAADLDGLGPRRTVVPSGFTCQSACILLGLGAGNRFEPDDQATLMFHRSSTHLGPDDCVPCLVVDTVGNAIQDAVAGSEVHRIMHGWANALAPDLGDVIARCRPNPFDTQLGIMITGQQFKAYRDGDLAAIPCPS